MKIICINGQGGVGKDSFVSFCGDKIDGVFNYSMVDGIKELAKIGGWNGAKELKDRKFLSDLKDLFDNYNDFSFNSVLSTISSDLFIREAWLEPENEMICFIHARESKDIQRWKDEHGARAVIIRRTNVEGEYGNHADDQVFDFDYDYCIWNNGTLDTLHNIAQSFIKEIREENWESHL